MARVLALVLSSSLIAIALAEIGARVIWSNSFSSEDLDTVVVLPRQHANVDRIVDRAVIDPHHPTVRFRTDARGYILPARRHPRPRATIAFLGGSTTECSAVREELRFHALVADRLLEQGWAVDTLNAGRSGNTVQDSLNLLLNHVVQDHPDIVVLMHATNDIGVLGQAGDYSPRMGAEVDLPAIGRWMLQMGSRRWTLAGMVRQILSRPRVSQRRDTTVNKALGENWQEKSRAYEARLRAFTHLSRDLGMTPILMTQPLVIGKSKIPTPSWAHSDSQSLFNDIIRRTAESESVPLIDLVREIQTELPDWDRPMHLFYDGMHVTDRGSRTYAEIISRELLPVLERMVRESR